MPARDAQTNRGTHFYYYVLRNQKFIEIRKRDGRIVPFDKDKITVALEKAGFATGEFGHDVQETLDAKSA